MALPKQPTGLPCTVCRKAPRMISRSGKELTRCEEHQREYWRSHQKHKLTPANPTEPRLCKLCKQNPCEVGENGKTGLFCTNCRTEFRDPNTPVDRSQVPRPPTLKYDPDATERECVICHEVLPIGEFRLNKGKPIRTCKTCYDRKQRETRRQRSKPRNPTHLRQYPTTTPEQRSIKPPVLFVDRVNQRLILGNVESETPLNERTLDHVIGMYRQLGYRVIDAVEQVETLTEKAGD